MNGEDNLHEMFPVPLDHRPVHRLREQGVNVAETSLRRPEEQQVLPVTDTRHKLDSE
jgi:hypothetical protein